MLFGKREVEHRIMLQEIVKEGSRIFDIGANIGYYAIMEAQMVGKKGEVIAIEPSPSNVNLLEKNVALNDQQNIRIVSAAVSDAFGKEFLDIFQAVALKPVEIPPYILVVSFKAYESLKV